MSHRTEQLEATLQRLIGKVLSGGLADPRATGMASVTGVKVSPDRRVARVSVSVMPAEAEGKMMEAIGSAAGYIRAEVSRRVQTRRMPELVFELDQSLKKQAAVLGAIDEAMEETDTETGEGEEAEDGEGGVQR